MLSKLLKVSTIPNKKLSRDTILSVGRLSGTLRPSDVNAGVTRTCYFISAAFPQPSCAQLSQKHSRTWIVSFPALGTTGKQGHYTSWPILLSSPAATVTSVLLWLENLWSLGISNSQMWLFAGRQPPAAPEWGSQQQLRRRVRDSAA